MDRGLAKGDEVPSINEDLVEPHVESMNYFLSEGMQLVVADMKPLEVCDAGEAERESTRAHTHAAYSLVAPPPLLSHSLITPPSVCVFHLSGSLILDPVCASFTTQIQHPGTKRTYRFWFSDPHVASPTKDDAVAGTDNRLYPSECRESVSVCILFVN